MSTALQGIVMNPHGFIPISGVTIVAQSTDGYSEGSSTTDSNGWFSLSGLSNKNWLAKITSAPPFVGNILLLPNDVDHADLSSVFPDQHHAPFVGLLDNAGEIVLPDGGDRIQITDDGIINADLLDVGILALSIDQGQIDHGSIGGTTDDDHSRYADLGGRSGGQDLFGGEDAGDDLALRSTTHATKGSVIIGSATLFEFDETTGQLILPTTGASAGILIGGDALWYRSAANVMRTPDALTVDGVITANADIQGNFVRMLDVGAAMVQATAPATPANGQIWLDTDATGTGGLGVLNVTTITSDDTLTTSQTVVLCDASSGAITVTLPAAAGNDGRHYHIKKIDSSANAVTIDGNGTETIDGKTTQVITMQYNSINIVCDGSAWHVI